jgi:hypothetical protein
MIKLPIANQLPQLPRLPLALLLSLPLLFLAATCQPSLVKRTEGQVKRIEMSKAPCFGSCPVFKLSIYANGIAVYEGERFTEKVGVYAKKLDPVAFQSLIKAFEEANLWQYPSIFRSEIPDLPTITIIWTDAEGNTKEIKGKEGRPQEVIELENMLDKIAESNSGWIQEVGEGNGLPAGAIANEIIVQLAPNVDPQVWVIPYGKQNLTLKEPISPSSNFWLVTYDNNIIPPQEMIDWLRKDPYVISAEFNKTVSGRR